MHPKYNGIHASSHAVQYMYLMIGSLLLTTHFIWFHAIPRLKLHSTGQMQWNIGSVGTPTPC